MDTLEQHIEYNNHPPIIPKVLFEQVQIEKQYRSNILRNDGGSEIKTTRYNSGYALGRRCIPPYYKKYLGVLGNRTAQQSC